MTDTQQTPLSQDEPGATPGHVPEAAPTTPGAGPWSVPAPAAAHDGAGQQHGDPTPAPASPSQAQAPWSWSTEQPQQAPGSQQVQPYQVIADDAPPADRGPAGGSALAHAGQVAGQQQQTPSADGAQGADGEEAAAPPTAAATATRQEVPSGAQKPRQNGNGAIGDKGVTGSRQNQEGTNQSVDTWEMEPIIEMIDVHKAFGSFKVLDGVTFRIPKDGVTVLMGPSGTGKSVGLRHIVGLLMPDKGDIIVRGKHVPKLKEKEILELRRKIGMLFQDGALFSSMNLYDNVAFPLRQHTKYSETKVREVVMQRLSEVGLAGAEKRMPNELSGGMRKRAGFARALVMEPEILLFDEPDSGLDPVRTTLLCDLIREISAKYKATSIVISHDVNGVRRMADFIGILYKGKMRHFGTKEQIENSPDEFVKQFFNAESEGPLGMD